MTSNRSAALGGIRKLWPTDTARFRDHLLRLDRHDRRMRFAHSVSDSFLEDYAARLWTMGSVAYGHCVGDEIRAAAELRPIGDHWTTEAEAAFSVETAFQGRGIGRELMGRVIQAARNRGINRLHLSCLADNSRMQHIARHYGATLRFECGDVIGEVAPASPNCYSLMTEAIENQIGFMLAVLDVHARKSTHPR